MFQPLSGGAVEGKFYEEEMGAWAVSSYQRAFSFVTASTICADSRMKASELCSPSSCVRQRSGFELGYQRSKEL